MTTDNKAILAEWCAPDVSEEWFMGSLYKEKNGSYLLELILNSNSNTKLEINLLNKECDMIIGRKIHQSPQYYILYHLVYKGIRPSFGSARASILIIANIVIESNYYVAKKEELLFEEITCRLPCLRTWMNKGINTECIISKDGKSIEKFKTEYIKQPVIEYEVFDKAKLSFIDIVRFPYRIASAKDTSEIFYSVAIYLKFNESILLSDSLKILWKTKQFFEIAVNSPLWFQTITVFPPKDIFENLDNSPTPRGELNYAKNHNPIDKVLDNNMAFHDSSILFSFEDCKDNFATIFNKWIELYDTHSSVLDSFFISIDNEEMTPYAKFILLLAGCESLHKLSQTNNSDAYLIDRLSDLLREFDGIIPYNKEFLKRIVKARNKIVHESDLRGQNFQFLIRANALLINVYKFHILKLLGFNDSFIDKVSKKHKIAMDFNFIEQAL